MEKKDKGFSIIVAVGMFLIGILSFFYSIEYFKHIADAIVLPLFLLTIFEIIGHIKASVLSTLSYESSKLKIHELWLHREYDRCKDDTELYILIGAILIASAPLANLPFMVEWTSTINATAITIFTFALFVIEPWIVDFFAYKVGEKVSIEVNVWAKREV